MKAGQGGYAASEKGDRFRTDDADDVCHADCAFSTRGRYDERQLVRRCHCTAHTRQPELLPLSLCPSLPAVTLGPPSVAEPRKQHGPTAGLGFGWASRDLAPGWDATMCASPPLSNLNPSPGSGVGRTRRQQGWSQRVSFARLGLALRMDQCGAEGLPRRPPLIATSRPACDCHVVD